MRHHIMAAPDCRSHLEFVSACSQEINTRAAAAVDKPARWHGNEGACGAPASAANKATPCGSTSRLPSTAAAVWRLFLHIARRETPERRPPLSCQQGCMALQAAAALPLPPPTRRRHAAAHQGCRRCLTMCPKQPHQLTGPAQNLMLRLCRQLRCPLRRQAAQQAAAGAHGGGSYEEVAVGQPLLAQEAQRRHLRLCGRRCAPGNGKMCTC